MRLITADHCPFCHRCQLVLQEKDLAYETLEIDLSQKSRFRELTSPYERVPVLQDAGATIYESSIINMYLEEAYPETPLLPSKPAERAAARFWIDFCDTRFMPTYFNLLKASGTPSRDRLRTRLIEHLAFIEKTGLKKVGEGAPYWLGRAVSLVDFAFYPFFERFASVEVYRGVEIPEELTRLSSWRGTMSAQSSVRQLARSRAHYIEYYGQFYSD